jgi:hypothetical protein
MFTGVIGALTSLLPKYFIFGSYVPVLIFSFINAGLTYLLSAWGRHAVDFTLATNTPLTITIAFVATVVLAYVLSSIDDFLREFLEGYYERFLPAFFTGAFRENERRRRDELEVKYRTARRQRFMLERNITAWQEQLRQAAIDGATNHPTSTGYDPENDCAATTLRTLRERRRKSEAIDFGSVKAAVDAMDAALRTFNSAASVALASDHRDLLVVIDAILSIATETEYENSAMLAAFFGTGSLKTTRMGNIAAAMQSYAVGRYGMDLTIFFTRLQAVLVKSDDKGLPIVLDAKAQLDFLVACCWFSGATTFVWFLILVAQGGSSATYFVVAGAGPVLTVAFYYLACENYIKYAEAVKACVDINRFGLLRAIDVPLPVSARVERRIWSALSRATLSRQEGDEMSYEHPQK